MLGRRDHLLARGLRCQWFLSRQAMYHHESEAARTTLEDVDLPGMVRPDR